MGEDERDDPPAPDAHEYTAFEKWDYKQVIYKGDQDHSWRDMANSYFFACEPLIRKLAVGELREDIEGTAAVFLFRHYLELELKQIVFSGRLLIERLADGTSRENKSPNSTPPARRNPSIRTGTSA